MIAREFDPAFDASTIELRESKGGKYLGVTITVTATSREQLDELYRTLSTHPDGQGRALKMMPPRSAATRVAAPQGGWPCLGRPGAAAVPC